MLRQSLRKLLTRGRTSRPRSIFTTTATQFSSSEHSVIAKTTNSDVIFSSGKIARLASGAVISQIGNSVILATAVSNSSTQKDFMPLTVDFRTKAGAVGVIPGNLFRKEMGVGDTNILSARLIDRTLRPLFPDGYHHESQIITTLQSFDPEHSDVEVQSVNAASTALCISDIPFNGPCAAVRIALSINGKIIVNPTNTYLESEDCTGHILYAGVESHPIMLEGEMKQWSEKNIVDCMRVAHNEIQPLLEAQIHLMNKCGKTKRNFTPCVPDKELLTLAHDIGYERALEVVISANGTSKDERGQLQTNFYDWMKEELTLKLGEENVSNLEKGVLHKASESVMKAVVRECALKDTPIRFDGRQLDQVRDILLDTDILPAVHGSSLFSRGDTQTLCTSTLGGADDAMQILNSLAADVAKSKGENRIIKNFFLQYEFPPYSVNEVGRIGGVNRRMVGHGALAEKALGHMVPQMEIVKLSTLIDDLNRNGRLNYSNVIRVTSEVSGSDGSSSMATVCGATACLQDAGVELKAPVAGVSIGLMTPATGPVWDNSETNEDGKYQLLTDILGAEDHFGDMDFKIAGTRNGVTALQLDMKQQGIPINVLSKGLDLAKDARISILNSMDKSQEQKKLTNTSKSHVKNRVIFELDDPSSMGKLIGTKGANIRALNEEFQSVSISTSRNNVVDVSGTNKEELEKCVSLFLNVSILDFFSINFRLII
jgi:polyribonucleotide nucleotidyltransferase